MQLFRTALLAAGVAIASAGSFTDDDGVTHTWTAANPTIVIGTHDAYSLLHMGLPASQIKATFGTRASSGSNYGGVYANGNVADHGDHSSTAYDPSAHPSDPTPEELSMLAGTADLSPGCSTSNFWCAEFDQTILDSVGWPDLIIQGPYGGPYALEQGSGTADYATTAAAARGIPIIKLNVPYSSAGTSAKDFVSVTQKFEELATALGASNVASYVRADKTAMCSAVRSFKRTARRAADRGVRALALYAPYGAAATNGDVGAFLMSPDKDQVLLMLEELGMGILHTDVDQTSAWEYAVTSDWSAGTLSATNMQSSGTLTGEPVKYPVDFFLYDARVTLDFTSQSFKDAWPHPALVAGQYAYWPSGGHIHSYRHATDILNIVGEKLAAANKIEDGTTEAHVARACTSVDVIDSETHRSTGLGPGEYACYNPIEYAWCEDFPEPDTASSSSNISAGTLGGVAAGCAIGGLVIGLLVGKLLLGKKSAAKPTVTSSSASSAVGGA